MLSYQHAYHAGNLADLHKHALLAAALDYLTRKDKPFTYLETHAGRGLYMLDSAEAVKTGEAQAGITRAEAEGWLRPDHPLLQAVSGIRRIYGPKAYPGSPMIAEHFSRENDRIHLAELHPTEHDLLTQVAAFATIHHQDGFEMAHAVCPPMPRRGMLLIDPSYEVKAEYTTIPRVIAGLARKWNVGVIALWYPILGDNRHKPMIDALRDTHPDALLSEVSFPPARDSHSMTGSGMFIINPPWGLEQEARDIKQIFAKRAGKGRA